PLLCCADGGVTHSTRSKEYAHDYRYFPEPDLVPLELDPAWVESIRSALPELPRARRPRFASQYGPPPRAGPTPSPLPGLPRARPQRFVSQYGLPPYDAEILTQSRALAEYYEAAV